jgi:hypothetical protein
VRYGCRYTNLLVEQNHFQLQQQQRQQQLESALLQLTGSSLAAPASACAMSGEAGHG